MIDPDKLTTAGIRRAAQWMRCEAAMFDRLLARIEAGEASPEQAAKEIHEILETQPVMIAVTLGQTPAPTLREVAEELRSAITRGTDATIEYQESLAQIANQ